MVSARMHSWNVTNGTSAPFLGTQHVDEGMNARAFVFGVRGCSVASASTVYIHWY